MGTVIMEGRTRREFLKGAAAVAAGGVVVGVVGSQLSCEALPGVTWWTPGSGPMNYPPASQAYLVRDEIKCYNCRSCMLTCSLVNEGVTSISLARRIVQHDSWVRGPSDVRHSQCMECADPGCVEVCPSGAAHVDTANGNIRTIDRAVCADYQASIAPGVCQLCIEACHASPSAVIWNNTVTTGGIKGVATKCDLCKSAPYWSEEGGFNGKQACVEVCPMQAIGFVKGTPPTGDEGVFNVNLRTANWDEVMDVPNRNAPYNLALTSPAVGQTNVLRPSGGQTYSEDPLPPPYTDPVAPFPGPGPTP